jgi:signal peptide peptidase SppA
MMGSGPLPNERRGDVAIVHVRGELEHHEEEGGCAESYEGIRKKWADALAGRTDDDEDADDALGPPKVIVMVIDSPGGVVSGLNETVKALQRLRRENPEVRTIAYCNEMAASAAYALACACEKIIAPPSAIVGSIGVISTMVSQARHDQKEGLDVRLLTSGTRKADGHPHAPISDTAVAVEQRRVDKLAAAFFAIAAKARGLSIDKIRALQAGIFLGKDAIRFKLVDEVKSLGARASTLRASSSCLRQRSRAPAARGSSPASSAAAIVSAAKMPEAIA